MRETDWVGDADFGEEDMVMGMEAGPGNGGPRIEGV